MSERKRERDKARRRKRPPNYQSVCASNLYGGHKLIAPGISRQSTGTNCGLCSLVVARLLYYRLIRTARLSPRSPPDPSFGSFHIFFILNYPLTLAHAPSPSLPTSPRFLILTANFSIILLCFTSCYQHISELRYEMPTYCQ